MKKVLIILMSSGIFILQFCSPSKKTTQSTEPSPPATTVATVSFDSAVMPLISSKCTPCHTKGEKALSLYVNAKQNIDTIISRVQRNPSDKGFMPHKRDKLSDSAINVFIQWKQTGLTEK